MNEISREDWLFAGLVSLIVFILGALNLTPGTNTWGDDHAAYLNEGIAIAEGRFQEQAGINYQYHPSQLPLEAENGQLVYAWGYPLLQSVIYGIVGFDRDNFSSVIWYKIPLLLSLSFSGGILTLFLRRRFSIYISAGAALVFCMSGNLFDSLNALYSDLPFLFFSMLTLWLMECLTSSIASGKHPARTGIIFGFAMWLTWETRLSGFTVCIAAMLGHAISVLRKEVTFSRETIWKHLLPYLFLALLVIISEHLWLIPPTQNISDIGKAAETNVPGYYWKTIFEYLDGLPRVPFSGMGYVFLGVFVLGIIVRGFRRNLHLTLLLLGTLAIVLSLPYTNGLRYIYNVLPLMIMFILHGFQFIGKAFSNILRKSSTIKLLITVIFGLGILFFSTANQVYRAGDNLLHRNDNYSYDAFSSDAKEIYRFIQNNTPEEAIIAFGKPRLLYLCTGRKSLKVGVNGHEMKEVDYYLKHMGINLDDQVFDTSGMEIILENDYLTLYRIADS